MNPHVVDEATIPFGRSGATRGLVDCGISPELLFLTSRQLLCLLMIFGRYADDPVAFDFVAASSARIFRW